MNWDAQTVERIVLDVMERLQGRSPTAGAAMTAPSVTAAKPESASSTGAVEAIPEKVITAEVLHGRCNGQKIIAIGASAILTPAARDFLQSRGIAWRRENSAVAGITTPSQDARNSGRWKVIISAAPENAVAAVDDLCKRNGKIERELAGLPTEAIQLAVSALARGDAVGVVLLTRESLAGACRANRNSHVRAAAIGDAHAVAEARRQIGANLFCIDPTGKSFFEVRNLLKDCVAGAAPRPPAKWDS